ncbi:Glycosyltransferase Gtf1 [Pseudovibrio axinellae]|uniref:Glycosyltransferase Gtf1 n=1 Tax=Pseudovibrio axinellae TaxID=989403 RepID=A0A165YB01_9HYPH|nr:glycosyltransferase [Pseudovibrio axinellae]KZL18627.1 Glycosyltransferase Gtf1 [Pseudovibrio axinellae]SER74036.1 Glycosyltransferase involved in cell wall bisynthesis [Pseudovibrio axinellae]
MKVVFYFGWSFAETGGTQRAVLAIGSDLVAKGHSVTILSDCREIAEPFYPYDRAVKIWHYLEETGETVSLENRHKVSAVDDAQKRKKSGSRQLQRVLPAYRRHRWQRRIRGRLPALQQALEQENPDVCIVFTPEYASLVANACPQRSFPLILSFRNVPEYQFDEAAGFPKDPVAGANFKDNIGNADAFSVLIPEFSRFLSAHQSKPICFIPNGVQLPSDPARPETSQQIVFTSRFDSAKRPKWLLEAFAKIAHKYPQWTLHMYGSGSNSEQAKNICAALGLSQQVKLHGPHRDLSEAYYKASIFCLPSRYEGFSNSLAEAMSHGLACVAVDDCISNRALLKEGVGMLSKAGEGSEGLASALDTLMANDDLRGAMGARARSQISQFTPQRVADGWDGFLKSVVADYHQMHAGIKAS